MKQNTKSMVMAVLLLVCVFAAGCGSKSGETDPASEQVLKITITPEPTATPAPDEISSDAVVQNGNITMVNSYLEQQ